MLWHRWASQMPPSAEDAHWRWDEYILMADLFSDQLACFILIVDGEAQGLMLLETEHRNDVGERDIHGLRLSAAPWNRGPNRRYKGIGTTLLARAVRLSVQMGYAGRFWLEALPGAENFYRYLGLVELPGRDDLTDLKRFKLDADAARNFLKSREGIWYEPA